MIARNPMREKLIAQYDVAMRNAATSPARRLTKSSNARKYTPRTVNVPKTIDQNFNPITVLPNSKIVSACKLMKSPSRP